MGEARRRRRGLFSSYEEYVKVREGLTELGVLADSGRRAKGEIVWIIAPQYQAAMEAALSNGSVRDSNEFLTEWKRVAHEVRAEFPAMSSQQQFQITVARMSGRYH